MENLSFPVSVFYGEHFDEKLFVKDTRRTISLELLLSDLTKLLDTLKTQLVETINRDYPHFVSLPSRLHGVDSVISGLEKPLQTLCNEVYVVRESLQENIDGLNEKMEAREEIHKEKEQLMNLIAVEELSMKLGRLLKKEKGKKDEDEDNDSIDDSDEHENSESINNSDKATNVQLEDAILMERIAHGLNQFRLYYTQLPPSANRQIHHLYGTMREEVQLRLKHELTETLRSLEASNTTGPDRRFQSIMRSYSVLQWTEEPHTIIAETWVKQYLAQNVTVSGLEGGHSGSTDGLPIIFQNLRDIISTKLCPLVRLVENDYRCFRLYVISRCVWPSLATSLCTVANGRIFQYTVPDRFHKNYTHLTHFLQTLETLCCCNEEILDFRRSAAYHDVIRHCDLPMKTYFQLRFQQITSGVDNSLDAMPTEVAPSESGFLLACSGQCYDFMLKCWSQEMVLRPMGHRFLQLSLLIAHQYIQWAQQTVVRSDAVLMLPFSQDAHLFSTKLKNDIAPIVIAALDVPPEYQHFVYGPIQEACDALIQNQLSFQQHWIEAMVKQCTETLSKLRDYPRLFRFSKQVEASESIMIALFDPVLASLNATQLEDTVRSSIITQLVQDLTQKFLDITSELLATAKKQEDTITKLKRNSASASISSGTAKVIAQLQLDLSQFDQQARGLGVSIESSDAYLRLSALINSSN